MRIHIHNKLKIAAATASAVLFLAGQSALAAVTAEEAKQLGTTLTALGAEMAGNKEGTIPAWDAKNTLRQQPPGWKANPPNTGRPFIDPYANEKPLFSITAANMDKYADKLDPGSAFLLKSREGYRMDIYPTHRSVPIPDWLAENNKKCAVTTQLTANGNSFTGAHACTPFPIPKNGYEALINMRTYMQQPATLNHAEMYLMDSRGALTYLGLSNLPADFDYWNRDRPNSPFLTRTIYQPLAPSNKAGDMSMSHYPVDLDKDDLSWSYTQGLRRVRLSPELRYDAVLTTSGGIYLCDERFGFAGRPDRFDFKLLGKKEMYIPYNGFKATNAPIEELTKTKYFLNPDVQRWELHRVWVIEATLKPGMRHTQGKKVFYADEDHWRQAVYVAFDREGKVVKGFYNNVVPQAVPLSLEFFDMIYDFTKGTTAFPSIISGKGKGKITTPPYPDNYFVPERLAGEGLR